MRSRPIDPRRRSAWAFISVGMIAGALSGLFGIGGGMVVVPALVMLGLGQRLAAGTSVAAILPTAAVGATGYAINGDVDWIAGFALAAGVIVGAQVGSRLLARLSRDLLFWLFFGFLVLAAVSLWISIPERGDTISVNGWLTVALVLTGVLTGTLSGILGVGGGVMIVPVLIFFFGASDLVAKGTSLFMMVPGSISGTVGNYRRRNVDLRAAVLVGVPAAIVSPFGIVAANLIAPGWSNVAFSILVAIVATQLAIRHIRARRLED